MRASHSGAAPSRSAGVRSVRTTGPATRWSAVNSAVFSVTEPSGATKPDTPTVETCTTDRPCSMARIREMANCCSDSAV